MKTASLDKVEANLQKCLEQCASNGPLVITEKGKTVGVLLGPEAADDLERLELARSANFWKMIEQGRKDVREGKVLSWDDFWKAVEERAAKREKGRVRRSKRPKQKAVG
jgi:PHD/YefM family antitoxin component YafN of YafNO toxin-antitoxin module